MAASFDSGPNAYLDGRSGGAGHPPARGATQDNVTRVLATLLAYYLANPGEWTDPETR